MKIGTPPNNTLSLAQLRNRMTDKIAHLTQRVSVIDGSDKSNAKILASIRQEIVMTERRLKLLDEKASKGAGE